MISPGSDGVLFAHVTSLWTKIQSKLFNQTTSWDYSQQRSFMAMSTEFVKFICYKFSKTPGNQIKPQVKP